VTLPDGVLALVPLPLQAQGPTDTSGSDDPFESISNFFDSGLWTAMSVLLQIFVVLLWLALAYWTYQDARRRIEAPGAVLACVALSVLIPFLGSVIYLIIRPPEYLDEARERELELLALERRLGELGDEEGQQLVGRLLAREGVASAGDPASVERALRQAGVASQDDLRDLDIRLTELEFRMRLFDRTTVPRDEPAPEPRRQRPQPPPEAAGESGRTGRWRRPRRDQDVD
jgi:hypothetical protein